MRAESDGELVGTDRTAIFVRRTGDGPPLLLLHGFPQTHLMWRDVAARLAESFSIVCADLPGYGRSACPDPTPDHAPHSKRAMALDLVAMMDRLGHARFAVAGHDRGGRVAYRMALDHPDRIERLGVLDIVPIAAAFDRADSRFALGYWPWSLLAQDPPLPETILATCAEAIVEAALGGWGSPGDTFPDDVKAAYAEALRDPAHARAICEEYRAAATIDRDHDAADLAAGRRIACPTLALWSAAGPLGEWYGDEGGPLALWRPFADDLHGRGVEGGHFFPEERPEETARALRDFFGG